MAKRPILRQITQLLLRKHLFSRRNGKYYLKSARLLRKYINHINNISQLTDPYIHMRFDVKNRSKTSDLFIKFFRYHTSCCFLVTQILLFCSLLTLICCFLFLFSSLALKKKIPHKLCCRFVEKTKSFHPTTTTTTTTTTSIHLPGCSFFQYYCYPPNKNCPKFNSNH
jgi:hypothetical protein